MHGARYSWTLSPKMWPCEERPAAVRLHEVLDGGVLLRLAAEDLGDDAFHLAAVAAVDQAGAPGDQRVAGDDQPASSPSRRCTSSRVAIVAPYVRRNWAQGIMLAIISRIVPAALAHSATRPRFRPW